MRSFSSIDYSPRAFEASARKSFLATYADKATTAREFDKLSMSLFVFAIVAGATSALALFH